TGPYGLRSYDCNVTCLSARTDVRWALKQPDVASVQLGVTWPIPGLIEPVFIVQVLLLDEWQNQHSPTVHRLAIRVGNECGRKGAKSRFVLLQCQHDITKVVRALGPSRRPTRRLKRRQ